MSRFKQLIHEVHRRSLWQVLGIYVVGAWIGYEVIQSLTEGMGLPEWFPALAVVLFIIGLPIVLATAFVQEGVGRHRGSDGSQPSELDTTSGGTPIPPPPGAPDTAGSRLFTWRNAITGGVVAFALWGAIGTTWLLLGDRTRGADASTRDADGPVGSIAVLAFEDMSPEGDQEYFSDGISEEILDQLAKVEGLRVAARSSSFKFKGQNQDVREVGDQLGVDAVLEGSVRKSQDRLRITAQLVSSEDGFHMWSDTYDRQLADVFAVQEEIAGEIVSALGFEPPEPTAAAARAPAQTIAAHDYYLLGRQRWNARAGSEDLEAALDFFRLAAEEDSLFARAHAAMALIYSVWPQYDNAVVRAEAIQSGKAEAIRATELDPTLPEPHAALCQIATWYEWDWPTADEQCRTALKLAPNYVTAHQWSAELLIMLGREEEALEEAKQAHALDPLTPINSHVIAFVHNQMGQYDSALAQTQITYEIDPEFSFAFAHEIISRFVLKRREGLVEAFNKWAQTAEDSLRYTEFANLYLDAIDDESARQQAVAMVPDLQLPFDSEALLYMLLDETDLALDWLEGMYDRRSFYLPEVLQRKASEGLRSDPRFTELLRKVGLDRPPAALD